MRIPPSRRLKKALRVVTDENEYLNSLESRQQYLDEMVRSIDSDFGTTLLAALEQLESNAFATLYKTVMPWRRKQAKAEIKTVQYIKGIFLGLRSEKAEVDAMKNQIEQEYLDASEN